MDFTYNLDACAVIAWLDKEEGSEKVNNLMKRTEKGEITLCMHTANVLEVYYDRLRKFNTASGDDFLSRFYRGPVTILNTISKPFIREAGRFKSTYNPPLGDCFALAATTIHHATLVTADTTDMRKIEEAEHFPILWIRDKPYYQIG
jgi:predicted nucleic acid-binding protein